MTSVMLPGILTGVVGMILAAVNYPIYKKMLERGKKKYSEQILTLSEKIMNK